MRSRNTELAATGPDGELRRTGRLKPGERLRTRGVPWSRDAGHRPRPGRDGGPPARGQGDR